MRTAAEVIEGAIEGAIEEHRITGRMWTAGDLCGVIGEALAGAGYDIVKANDPTRPPRRPSVGR